ncbi:uncharacterized protein RAG0_09306 [Rhynchosporium agropyri]|uniref:Uncharacterized protein n=3 Tax=Rhynchosporium TaxID=38037 RepID=A0A1E1MVT2_RHYSE|nr:uncharacterized protein RAG0_09306 [Rhynchosporium agropyri]CZT06677.1 uncharacterized protein RCO7_11266 [Rhynchosporium commune]CZT53196.1 uncharacterized protein RSE6_14664 [Rhynchosporium secalis]
MSKIRGIFPLFLATAIGVGNGLWVFGPEFRNQQLEKEEQEKKAAEVAKLSGSGTNNTVESLKMAEAAASRTIATETALKPAGKSQSRWWPNTNGFWEKERNKSPTVEPVNKSQEVPKDKP